jgi:hypothetical protein
MAASLVLALGALVAGAFGLAYMLDSRVSQPPASVSTAIHNPGFEQGMLDWRVTGGSTNATITQEQAHSGNASLQMKSEATEPGSQSVLVQTMPVEGYAGKRVRVSAYLKTEGLSENVVLWLHAKRVEAARSQVTLAIDNMADRPVRGTTDWQQYTMVLDIPSKATHLDVGAIMNGGGVAWVDDFEIEEVGTDVPTTGTGMINSPTNLDFERGLDGWGRTGWSPNAYDYSAEATGAYEGKAGARVRSKSPFDGGDKYTLLEQYVDAEQFVAKRVRVTGYVKGNEVSGIAGLFLRTYEPRGIQRVVDLSRLEGMAVTGTSDWRKYEVVMDVPAYSYAISYGLSITGEGEVWLDSLAVEVVGDDVPITASPEYLTP